MSDSGRDVAQDGGRAARVGGRGRRRLTQVVLIAAALMAGPAGMDAAPPVDQPVRLEIQARPIEAFEARDPTRRRFGPLEFRGGLELTARHAEFGGISAIRVAPDGQFIAASDRGNWLRGRIVYDGERPAGIAGAEMAPMLGPDGRPITAGRGWYDTESIAEDGGTLYVGLERVHAILRFDYGRDGLRARGTPIPVPRTMKTLPANKGIEALVAIPAGLPLAGTLVALSERALDRAGNTRGFLLGGPSPGEFAVKRTHDYDISDAALLASGDLLLLERKFSWTSGIAIRLRRIPLAALRPGAVADGPVLFEADMGFQIDNMEGLSVHRAGNGDTVLTLISDDNFSVLQRTLLLQFTLLLP